VCGDGRGMQLTNADFKTLVNVVVIDLGVGVSGSVLSAAWLRTTQGTWPERDTIVTLTKIWLGIAAAGVLFYLLIKYG
jgi:hypothetical protein